MSRDKSSAVILLASALSLLALMVLPACNTTTVQPTITVTVTQPSGSTQTTTTPTSATTGSLQNGQDIFMTAIDASGQHVGAQGFVMMSRWFACADCHGTDGHGGTVYMMMAQYDVPNIAWPVLTGANYVPAYTVDTLKRAITQGEDQQGKALNPFMPRWSMSSQDLSDLVSYLQTLK